MATTVTKRGQVTIPKSVLIAANIKPGDQVEVRAIEPGKIFIAKFGAAREQLEKVINDSE